MVDETNQTVRMPTKTKMTKKGKNVSKLIGPTSIAKSKKRKQMARKNLSTYQTLVQGKDVLQPIEEKLEISSEEEEPEQIIEEETKKEPTIKELEWEMNSIILGQDYRSFAHDVEDIKEQNSAVEATTADAASKNPFLQE